MIRVCLLVGRCGLADKVKNQQTFSFQAANIRVNLSGLPKTRVENKEPALQHPHCAGVSALERGELRLPTLADVVDVIAARVVLVELVHGVVVIGPEQSRLNLDKSSAECQIPL